MSGIKKAAYDSRFLELADILLDMFLRSKDADDWFPLNTDMVRKCLELLVGIREQKLRLPDDVYSTLSGEVVFEYLADYGKLRLVVLPDGSYQFVKAVAKGEQS